MATTGEDKDNAKPTPAKRHEVEWYEIGALELDSLNPRLPPDIEDTSPNGLLTMLATEYGGVVFDRLRIAQFADPAAIVGLTRAELEAWIGQRIGQVAALSLN